MAYLINRNPPARLECLYYLCKFIANNYNVGAEFRINDLKYNSSIDNIFNYCSLLKTDDALGITYCPYKDNPLNQSGCSLTNSLSDDSTKSKEVSNTVNALDALGVVMRVKNSISLTNFGKNWADTNYDSQEMLKMMQAAVLRYGVFVGFLHEIKALNKNQFNTSELRMGYPNTTEIINYEGMNVQLSIGSQKDSNTRTKSCLLAWGVSCGFFVPDEILNDVQNSSKPSHISTKSYIQQTSRNLRKYTILQLPKAIENNEHISENPLSYNQLTKDVNALRENNQENIRNLTKKYVTIVNNRRYAIVYGLNEAYVTKKTLNIPALISHMKKYPELFIINLSSFDAIIREELFIGFMAGTPFKFLDKNSLRTLAGINIDVLNVGAPQTLKDAMETFKIDE